MNKSQKKQATSWDDRILKFKSSTVYEYVQVLFVAFAVVFGFLRPFVIEAYEIPSGSMRDTLLEGDRILVCKYIYGVKIPFTRLRLYDYYKPEKGNIFVFVPPHEPDLNFVKRIVATGNDTVETRGPHLYVNGKLIHDEAYAKHSPILMPNYGPVTVPEGYVFAMGDNRDRSSDSRLWRDRQGNPVPFVSIDNIKGKAFLIYWSQGGRFWELHKVRWKRLGKILRSQFSSDTPT